jgi:aromatic-L-amino-acid/L-tryptophan decarboxylase
VTAHLVPSQYPVPGAHPGPPHLESAGHPMFRLDPRLARLVLGHCLRYLALDEPPLHPGGDRERLGEVLAGLIGPEGHDPADVLAAFFGDIASTVIACDSPRFLAFMPAAPAKTAILFDLAVSCLSLHGTSWLEAAGPVAAENQALRVLADAAGLPAGAGGCFVSGGSSGNLSALLAARDLAGSEAPRPGGHPRAGARPRPGARPKVALTMDAHSSVGKALHVLGAEPFLVPAPGHRLTAGALRQALATQPGAAGVIAVVATAGTTNAGAVDDLAGVAQVAREHGLWFHVDAAYGGAALFAPSVRPLFAGIEHADSLVIDPHKWLFAPFDCAALLYRDPRAARKVHAQQAAYLDAIHDGEETEWNPSDYAYHLTRRARGLPLWFGLAVHGTGAYRDAVEATLATARYAAACISAADGLELACEPQLSVVLFRREGWGWQEYRSWSARILAERIAFAVATSWDGAPAARLCFLHPGTTKQMVDELIATIRP